MNDFDKEIIDEIETLKVNPPRDHTQAHISRRQFISAVKQKHNSVTEKRNMRHIWWNSIFLSKGLNPMKLATILVIISMLLGGTGASVAAAAQNSLPGDALYDLKLKTEEIRFDLTKDEEEKVGLAMYFAQKRYDEMQALIEDGLNPPEETFYQLQMQYQLAMQYALETEDPEESLEKIRTRLESQYHGTLGLQTNAPDEKPGNTIQNMLALDELVRNQIRMVETGLEAPLKLQEQLKLMIQKPEGANDGADKSMQNQEPQGNGNNGDGQNQNGSNQNSNGGQKGNGGK